MGEIGPSVLIFAPGLVLLAIFAFIGLLMRLERAGVLATVTAKQAAAGTAQATEAQHDNPAAGDVVAGLKQSSTQETGATTQAGRATGT